jgi:hypothetical protein
MQKPGYSRIRSVGIRRNQARYRALRCVFFPEDDHVRSRFRELAAIKRISEKSDRARARMPERSDGIDYFVSVSAILTVEAICEVGQGRRHFVGLRNGLDI